MDNLEELERLLAKATPGEWRRGADLIRIHPDWRDSDGSCTPENYHRNGYAKTIATIGKEDGDWRGIGQQVSDAALIVALRNAAPSLIATAREVERLRVENERLPRDLVDTKAEYHRVSEVALDLSREADELRAEIARLMGLVVEAYLEGWRDGYQADECKPDSLGDWSASTTLAKIKENTNG